MQGKCTCARASVHLSNTTAKRRGVAKQLLCQFRRLADLNDVDVGGRERFQHLSLPRTRKGEAEFHRRSMGRDAADFSARLGANVGPDGGLWSLLWLHTDKEERFKLACSQAWKPPT